MKYRIVQRIEGMWVKSEVEPKNLHAWASVRGYTVSHINKNPRQRAELQEQPVFSGLVGPMWDGDAIRYEDQTAHDILST